MRQNVITVCLYPFPGGPLWVVCETVITSMQTVDSGAIDSFTCESNQLLHKFSSDDRVLALETARQVAKDRKLPVYLHNMRSSQDGDGSLEFLD